jgi:hypothetical protein
MLDAFIIEEIKRRDRDRTRDERPAIELPLPPPAPNRPVQPNHDDDQGGGDSPDRGVVIIDYGITARD